MGTDSHSMVEVREHGEWRPIFDPIWPNEDEASRGKPLAVAPDWGRRYGLFSLLADVVNRTGRMGTTQIEREVEGYGKFVIDYDMDDGGHQTITPLAAPRGIPDDCFLGWREFCKQEGIHSPTWFTLDELEDTDLWDQTLYEDAVVIEPEYREYKETGKLPEHLARNVGGPNLRVVTEEEYEAGERGESTAIRIKFERGDVRRDAGSAWWATLAVMHLIAPNADRSKVRLLVAFDS